MKSEPKLLKPEVGKYYKTYGGWKALVIWKYYKQNILDEEQQYYLIVHKPKEEDEYCPVTHDYNGKAVTTFSVDEPPRYTEHHPADLKEEYKIKGE